MPHITFDNVGVTFGGAGRSASRAALDECFLSIPRGQFVSILGPSGCGKTTLLRLVAGLIAPDTGQVTIDGSAPIPGRQSAFVFQSFRLLPWKTALANVTLALRPLGLGREERNDRARHYLELVGLSSVEAMYPGELSGGMKQRLALARALAVEAPILLMDEPFASLDAQSRELMQEELKRLTPKHRPTVLFVTHSVDEALILGDRLVLMSPRPGRVHEDADLSFASHKSISELRASAEFQDLRDHIWSQLREMVLNDSASDFFGRGENGVLQS
ncbi:ABC transporter ATP-binding protein [Celeribacter sp.]|uniref:ABC transporter ATP-binding protein n=1 Tax=Celeribacter sp. TaxID=1890673 RepID=UPI003A90E473